MSIVGTPWSFDDNFKFGKKDISRSTTKAPVKKKVVRALPKGTEVNIDEVVRETARGETVFYSAVCPLRNCDHKTVGCLNKEGSLKTLDSHLRYGHKVRL